jgi:hypothetical protein
LNSNWAVKARTQTSGRNLSTGKADDNLTTYLKFDDAELSDQIEAQVAELLHLGQSATVPLSVIEGDYKILNAAAGTFSGSLHQKCAEMIDTLKVKHAIEAQYSVLFDCVIFTEAESIRHNTTEP